ncbi:sensor histidine kinase [Pararhizobium sp. LjRoot238]|uniref:sensor histidine kinase n=1 Tax=Pararhizobium sp. LjRoot238 TaxID=3342293 RepID=UPI003ECF8CAF
MSDRQDKQSELGAPWRALLRSRLRRPLSFYLTVLLLVAIVPSFVFSMIILKRSIDEQERVVTALLKGTTGAVTRVVEREIDGMLTTLKVLSTASAIDNRNLDQFYERASSALADTDSNLLVIDRTHNQLFNTRVPFGSALGKASDPASIDLAFRNGGPLISNVFFGRTAGKWVFNVYLPITTPLGNNDYLLTLTQNAENMSKAVSKDVLSPGWNAALVDGADNVIASSDPTVAVGRAFFMNIVPALRVGVGEATHDGVAYRTVTEFSVLTGWKVIAWAKSADVDAPALWSYLWLSLGGILFAGIAVAGSVTIAGLLTQGVKVLARDAHLLGAGRPIAPRRHMISEIETVSTALAEAARSRRKAENEIRFLMREVAHRSKNQLTVIQSMLNQSLNAAESRVDFAEAFRKRIAGLARSTDLMIANAAQGVDFQELAQNQLQPFIPDDPQRVRLSGPSVRLDAQVSQTLGMALHELATNATKYGALGNSKGIVDLKWSVSDGAFLLIWRETGADIDADTIAPARKGFGTIVLERMLGMALDAELERIMHADGIEWRMKIPEERLNANLSMQS